MWQENVYSSVEERMMIPLTRELCPIWHCE